MLKLKTSHFNTNLNDFCEVQYKPVHMCFTLHTVSLFEANGITQCIKLCTRLSLCRNGTIIFSSNVTCLILHTATFVDCKVIFILLKKKSITDFSILEQKQDDLETHGTIYIKVLKIVWPIYKWF